MSGMRSDVRNASLLAEKTFDADGRSLTPNHAKKDGKRYRYYVSKVPEAADVRAEPEWRIPASELERAVTDAVTNDRELRMAREREGKGSLSKSELSAAIYRVQIEEGQLQITLNAEGHEDPRCIIALFTLRRRGVETRLVLNGVSRRDPDTVLIRRILRAMDWVDQIKTGLTIAEIAASQDITREHITHNMQLAFLSPKILRAIAEGEQRPDVSARQLRRMDIPVIWPDQDGIFL